MATTATAGVRSPLSNQGLLRGTLPHPVLATSSPFLLGDVGGEWGAVILGVTLMRAGVRQGRRGAVWFRPEHRQASAEGDTRAAGHA
jgi:hypothetical protein